MSAQDLKLKVQELRELKRMMEELAAEIDAIQDAIKAEMTAAGTEVLHGVDFKITWREIVSKRIDTAALKKALPDIVERFTIETRSKRFTIA